MMGGRYLTASGRYAGLKRRRRRRNQDAVSKSKQKGGKLEYAVHQIEELILRQDPGLRGANARIHRNRWFNISGVSFEVDVLVTTGSDDSPQYHVIECKNWEKPVGVPEVSHLETKRRLLKAKTTTLIARTFTEPARNLATLYGIELVAHSEKFVTLEVGAPVFSSKIESGGVIQINFYETNTGPKEHFDYATTPCLYGGREMRLSELVDSLVQWAIGAAEARDPRNLLPGFHSGKAQFVESFALGQLVIAGKNVGALSSEFDYSTEVVFPAVVTKFGVERRGGLIRLEYPPGTMDVKNLALEVFTKPVPSANP